MMTLIGKSDGYMTGLIFRDDPELGSRSDHETMTFEVRPSPFGVDLHITHTVAGGHRQRANTRHMIHRYSVNAYRELVHLLTSATVAEMTPAQRYGEFRVVLVTPTGETVTVGQGEGWNEDKATKILGLLEPVTKVAGWKARLEHQNPETGEWREW